MTRMNQVCKSLFAAVVVMIGFGNHGTFADGSTPALASPFVSHPTAALTNDVSSVAFSPDGKSIAASYSDGTVKVWDAQTQRIRWVAAAHDTTRAIAFSPDSKTIATVGRSEHVMSNHARETTKLWSVSNGALIWEKTNLLNTAGSRFAVAFSSDGASLASAGGTYGYGDVQLLNAKTGELQQKVNRQTGPVETVKFTPDGSSVVSPYEAYGVSVWSRNTGKLQRQWRTGQDYITALAVSPDGKNVVTGNGIAVKTGEVIKGVQQAERRLQISLRDTQSGAVLSSFEPPDAVPYSQNVGVENIEFSPDGNRIAYLISTFMTSPIKTRIEVKDIQSRKLVATIEDPNSIIQAFAFSPDGKRIMTGDNYGALKLWPIHQEL